MRRLGQTPQSTSSSTKLEDILPPIPSLYISCSSPFQEVEDFVSDSICRYNMKIVRLEGDMKQGLERYLDGQGKEMKAVENGTTLKRKRNVKAIFIGTRRTDPHCGEWKIVDVEEERERWTLLIMEGYPFLLLKQCQKKSQFENS